jgi:hypothetical protein
LRVVVRAGSSGDGMWHGEAGAGNLALLSVPLARFGNEVEQAPEGAYVALPSPGVRAYTLQNRFAGDYLVYGAGDSWGYSGSYYRRQNAEQQSTPVLLHHVTDGRTYRAELPHGVDRIEPLGRHAVVVGSDGEGVYFSSFRLDETPTAVDRYRREGASQGETRSHGFFYLPSDDRDGVLGLPLAGSAGRPGWAQLAYGSAEVSFLRVTDLRFRPLGALEARAPRSGVNDGCQVSCADWYGNARPIFYRGRTFALMGYELVEGRVDGEHLREVARVNFSPDGSAQTRAAIAW